MQSFPDAKQARVVLSLLLAGCTGGESLPDDPRPSASAEAVVPAAAVSAVLSPSPPAPTTTGTGLALPGVLPSGATTLREDPPSLSRPGLPPEIVARITRKHHSELLACLVEAPGAAASAGGSITVTYVIGPSGSVTSASTVGSTLPDAATNTCVLDAFRRFSFPSPTGPALVVTQRLYFMPPPP